MSGFKAIAASMAAMMIAMAPMAASAAVEQASDEVTVGKTPDGQITLSAGDVAVGVGFVWGGGTLTFQGADRPFSLSGLSVLDVGAAHVSASGSVWNLKRLEDFPGTYSALSAGATVAGGANAIVLRNQNGVVLKLTGTSEGLRLNIAAEGIKVKFKK
jgi:hypothetical protein